MMGLSRAGAGAPAKLMIGVIAIALVMFAGFSLARAADGGTTISGCVSNSGVLRVLDEGGTCKRGESAISWNSEGPTGPQGPAGEDGQDGNDGDLTVNVITDGTSFDAPTMYLRIKGDRSGDIQGGSTKAGHEGWTEVYGFSHEVVSPRDAASGLPTGKRQHKPISITKPIDKSTPLLMNALYNNENLSEFELEFYRTNPATGAEVHYYTIELTNASVARATRSDEPGTGSPAIDTFEFTYQKIVETWEDGGITAEDDWETPVS